MQKPRRIRRLLSLVTLSVFFIGNQPTFITAAENNPHGNQDSESKSSDSILDTVKEWLGNDKEHQPLPYHKSNGLGLEKFYQFVGKNTGAGSSAIANLHNGNIVFNYNPFQNPGRGLSSFIRLTYNSLDTSDSPIGQGWSLSASSLMRQGNPLEFKSNGHKAPQEVTLTDGDGTQHVFHLEDPKADQPEYKEPAGVNLHLELLQTGKKEREWVFTSPDRTQFFFDGEGYQTKTRDKNGNELRFIYEERHSNKKPTKFLTKILDPAGREAIIVNYYTKEETKNPKIINKIQSITDVSGRTLVFAYHDKTDDERSGTLAQITDGAGTKEAKTLKFEYDSKSKHTKMSSITDPRGHTTYLHYLESGKDKGKIEKIIDRLKGVTTFTYKDTDAPPHNSSEVITTVTDALKRSTQYRMNGYGNVTEITNAQGHVTRLHWDDDNNVDRLEEPNGAVTTWSYDDNGLLLNQMDAVNNAIEDPSKRKQLQLDYQYSHDGHVADLVKKTSPEGRTYTFTYDKNGNLTSVTDPKGNATNKEGDYTTKYTYYGTTGLLHTSTDANGNVTTYGNPDTSDYGYDPNGYPTVITDALKQKTRYQYGERGEVLSVIDAKGKKSEYTYDVFKRPLTSKTPKDQDKGQYIITPSPVYDRNDNIIEQTAPNEAKSTYTYDAADQRISATQPKDTETSPERKTTYEFDLVGNLLKETEPKGTLTNGPTDFTTIYAYDELDQVISVTNSKGHKITYEYDQVGNAIKVTEPKGNETKEKDDYTTFTKYDLNHRVIKVTDAAGKSTLTKYDLDGNTIESTDKEGNTTFYQYDERNKLVEVKIPHKNDKGTIKYHHTKYEYDQVGNQTKTINPRGVETAIQNDFTHEQVYDELNRVKEVIYPHAGDSSNPDKMIYRYDSVGHLTEVSAPPSSGQSTRNNTVYTYFDNGWLKSTKDSWNISTTYDYNEIGKQVSRTIAGAGGSSPRTMTWSYYPDGKLQARSDTGVVFGAETVVTDNIDRDHVATTGTWEVSTSDSGYEGNDHSYNQAGTGEDTFIWNVDVPEAGAYNVYVKYVSGPDRITDAEYTVTHKDGSTVVENKINQQQNGGNWVLLGKFDFDKTGSVKLSDKTSGNPTGMVVSADAVKLEKDTSGVIDEEQIDFKYDYDANGNMTSMTDHSKHAKIKTYQMDYTELNQASQVKEIDSEGVTKRTITFTYDANGNPLNRHYEKELVDYEYDARNLVTKVTQRKSTTDTNPKITRYEYNANGQVSKETLPNNNVTTYTYNLDHSLYNQETKKSNGTLLNKHTITYNTNGHKVKDVMQFVNDKGVTNKYTLNYEYDPMDRISKMTKVNTDTGATLRSETYEHDANNNVIKQTIGSDTTTYHYDRNRLVSANNNGSNAKYSYDVYGRLRSVTSAGTVISNYKYDGFDHIIENKSWNNQTQGLDTTKYEYDPLDRTSSKTSKLGTADEKTTQFGYLGLSSEVLTESLGDEVQKSYLYSPWGQRLTMVKHGNNGDKNSYYGYNPHTDVEMLYKEDGSVEGTYGYTAYGSLDKEMTTGPDAEGNQQYNPNELHNPYRYSAKRWDNHTQSYDMGFRNYSPDLNRFLTLDMYNGASDDMGLTTSPWTNNRYAFTGGNPISRVEVDGHYFAEVGGSGKAVENRETGVTRITGYSNPKENGFYYEGKKVEAKGSSGEVDGVINVNAYLRGVSLQMRDMSMAQIFYELKYGKFNVKHSHQNYRLLYNGKIMEGNASRLGNMNVGVAGKILSISPWLTTQGTGFLNWGGDLLNKSQGEVDPRSPVYEPDSLWDFWNRGFTTFEDPMDTRDVIEGYNFAQKLLYLDEFTDEEIEEILLDMPNYD
jgi:RHS repeat-associated protein